MNDKLSSMRYAGMVNISAIDCGFALAKPGVALRELDKAIEAYIRKSKCTPAFKGYQPEGAPSPFPHAACISPNDVVVHGVPGDYVLKDGDLLTIDVGSEYQGWYVDSARSRVIGGSALKHKRQENLIIATEDILNVQLDIIKNECTLLQLVEVAEAAATKHGVTIMPQWGGHGIADKIHLPPFIPSAIDRSQSKLKQDIETQRYSRTKLKTGQTICIEPVTTYGSGDIMIDEDGWTIRTTDNSLAAHTERCLMVTENGYELLS